MNALKPPIERDKTAVSESDYVFCRDICRTYAHSYYLATLSLPAPMRRATYALYGFVRLPDELIDNPADPRAASASFENWCADWETALATGDSARREQRAFLDTLRRYAIPEEMSRDFLSAMRRDLSCARYQTYADLEQYMYGSAAVVGLMMCRIIGVQSDEAYLPATRLGEAFQMTNFLRDIREDYRRGRIYLPLDDLARFDVTEEMLGEGRVTPEVRELLRFEVERTRGLYAEAKPGIRMLQPQGRRSVQIAFATYSAILNKIEAAQYDVFKKRLRTGKLEKLLLAAKAMCNA